MYRFALRPAWVLSHVLVGALLIAMVLAGLWQLRRLDERRDFNETVAERSASAPVPIGDLVAADDPFSVGESLEWRPVEVIGVFSSRTIRVANRSVEGTPGQWWLSPLTLLDGSTVLVNRGFVAAGLDAADVVPPPTGEVTVLGVIRPTQERVGFGGDGRAGDELVEVPRVDLAKLGAALADAEPERGPVLPVFVQVQGVAASGGEGGGNAPLPLPPPELTEGPHFGYAMQWFIFSSIALIGYPLVLRRLARSRAGLGSASERRSQVPIDDPPPIRTS